MGGQVWRHIVWFMCLWMVLMETRYTRRTADGGISLLYRVGRIFESNKIKINQHENQYYCAVESPFRPLGREIVVVNHVTCAKVDLPGLSKPSHFL